MTKITVIGAGSIGVETAKELALEGKADEIVLWNRPESEKNNLATQTRLKGIAQGRIALKKPLNNLSFTTNLEEALQDADIVIVTAGQIREKGDKRTDLLVKNSPVIDPVAAAARKRCPNATVIMTTNPVDTLTQRFQMISGFAENKVVGLGGVLDSARLVQSIVTHLGLESPDDVADAHVVGQHGEHMVPLLSKVSVRMPGTQKFIPLLQACSEQDAKRITAEVTEDIQMEDTVVKLQDRIVKDVTTGGSQFIQVLNASDHYGPAACLVRMANEILAARETDRSSVIPCATAYKSEKGTVYMQLPGTFSQKGEFRSHDAADIGMNPDEKSKWVKAVADNLSALQSMPPISRKYVPSAGTRGVG